MMDWLTQLAFAVLNLMPGRAGHAGIADAPQTRTRRRPMWSARRRGLSLVEMLVALAITAVLLTATMVAIDTSFKAYAIAAESASTQTSTRMVINRLLTLVRTSTAHGPLAESDPLPSGATVTFNNTLVESSYLQLVDPDGDDFIISWDATLQQLNLTKVPASGATPITQPILGGVTNCKFMLARRRDNDGNWQLERGSIDFTVEADDDASLDIEVGDVPPVRVIASTKPRRIYR
jgi:prepilin-type N-terminal cleavage/methylation domain-containing protein